MCWRAAQQGRECTQPFAIVLRGEHATLRVRRDNAHPVYLVFSSLRLCVQVILPNETRHINGRVRHGLRGDGLNLQNEYERDVCCDRARARAMPVNEKVASYPVHPPQAQPLPSRSISGLLASRQRSPTSPRRRMHAAPKVAAARPARARFRRCEPLLLKSLSAPEEGTPRESGPTWRLG